MFTCTDRDTYVADYAKQYHYCNIGAYVATYTLKNNNFPMYVYESTACRHDFLCLLFSRVAYIYYPTAWADQSTMLWYI